jgi:hypothetical protein
MYLTPGVVAIAPFCFFFKIFTNYLKQDCYFSAENETDCPPLFCTLLILSGWIFFEALSLMSSCLAIPL